MSNVLCIAKINVDNTLKMYRGYCTSLVYKELPNCYPHHLRISPPASLPNDIEALSKMKPNIITRVTKFSSKLVLSKTNVGNFIVL